MDSKVNLYKSLPPLVEGKVHGYLKLSIDEIIWTKRNPEDVVVLAYWWGELDSAQFRPMDIITGIERSDQETSKTYIIRTNMSLFKEYIKNCGAVDLVVTDYDMHEILGTGQITQLLDIFENKPYFRYVPIYNDYGNTIGELHVSIKLLNTTKSLMPQSKPCKQKCQTDANVSLDTNIKQKCSKEKSIKFTEYTDNNICNLTKITEPNANDIYRSILKTKRMEFENPVQKFNTEVTDKLVAQIVARAQKLRGAILKETYNDDSLSLSDNSVNESTHDKKLKNQAKLYEYILGKEMSTSDEHRALNTLRSVSPTPSLLNLASDTIRNCEYDEVESVPTQRSFKKTNENISKSTANDRKEISPLNHVDSIKIYIETFFLSSAGCRRVKSSCLTRTDGNRMPVTYIVQYDPTFGSNKQKNKKSLNKYTTKPVRICSKKEVGEVINFNHEGIHDLSNFNLDLDLPLHFKIFIRHLNQRSPTELGVGCVYIRDVAKTEDLSMTQLVAIINKGIKIGELKVSIELGCDYVHFGKHYVDAVISTKENIPLIEMQSLSSIQSDKYKKATGTHSKTSSKISSTQTKRIECVSSNNNDDLIMTKDITRHDKRNMDDKKVDIKNPEIGTENKILLHGLIHIAEGQNLPELSTYLICRAFWKEDRARSKLCINTKNPFYQFCQLVPLIHGTDLLERIKDNYIIVEVYCKSNTGTDNLLGIVKLPLHQLYVAYRDPLVLPYLLQSKYPVISVDEWVPICNPVNGQSCGQLLALVALGTAEQIAFLKMSRGLTNNSPHIIYSESSSSVDYPGCSEKKKQKESGSSPKSCNDTEVFHLNGNIVNDNFDSYATSTDMSNLKTQEIQTDISSIQQSNNVLHNVPESSKETAASSDHLVLHSLVDRLAHALSVSRSNVDRTAQTETTAMEKIQQMDRQLCFNPLSTSIPSDESDSASHTNNFHLPVESYRSVGVGAEFDEEADQKQNNNCNNTSFDFPSAEQNVEKDETDFNSDQDFFRAVIEIECALHLPKIEQSDNSIEPSTYVTFQKNQTESKNLLRSYTTTSVCLHSCNPTWNWRSDAKFPIELLTNDDKRLILKIWRLIDPNINLQPNPEKDIVIGFSAIDLSVLIAGFPTVSGWFHIMDFTGKCNGQIKVSITPVDNVSPLGKLTSTVNAARAPICNLSRSEWTSTYSYQTPQNANVKENEIQTSVLPQTQQNEDPCNQEEFQLNDPFISNPHNLDDASMSFLSLSLKQKLTELDEITKRLQSRLRDVTNNAFDDDFVNEFDLNEINSDTENNDENNVNASSSALTVQGSSETWESVPSTSKLNQNNHNDHDSKVIENRTTPSTNNIQHRLTNSNISDSRAVNYEVFDPGYCTGSNFQSSQNLTPSDYRMQCQNECSFQTDNSSENSLDYPVRGTKMHINHLLDKLSSQFPLASFRSKNSSVKNVAKLLTNVQQVKHSEKKNHFGFDAIGFSKPMQTSTENTQSTQTPLSFTSGRLCDSIADSQNSHEQAESQSCHKVSSVIRKELVAEDNNDVAKCDELSSYLITSNVRHMSVDSIFNPLLYQHVASDLHISNIVSSDGEAIDQLDNRYIKTFKTTLNNGLSRLENLVDPNTSLIDENNCLCRSNENKESLDNIEPLRVTPTGVSEDIGGKIDLKGKSNNNNVLMGSNNTETTIISLDKYSEKQTDTDIDRNSCSILSDSSVSAVSRQAPDGGNPTEDTIKPITTKQHNDSLDSSLSS